MTTLWSFDENRVLLISCGTVLDNQLQVKACDHGEPWKMKTILFVYIYWYTRIFIYSLWSTWEIRLFNILVFEICQIILTPLKSILPLYMNILTYTVFLYFMVSVILKWQFLQPYFLCILESRCLKCKFTHVPSILFCLFALISFVIWRIFQFRHFST